MSYIKLPKKMNRQEAKVDGLVAEKLRQLHTHRNWALEVKMKGGKVADHQKKALTQVENGKFKPYKLADLGQRMPFDYIYLGDADAIVCFVDGRNVHCSVNSGVMEYKFKI